MSTIGSSLSKGDDGTGLFNPTVLRQIAGVPKDMSRVAFDAAVMQERANITNNGTGIWANGEKISIFGEAGTRIWFVGTSGALSHARNVSYQGQLYALAADSNVFGATSGAPASGTGANGDYMADATAGLVYGPKASGVWPAGIASLAVPGLTADQLPDASAFTAMQINSGILTLRIAGTDYKITPAALIAAQTMTIDALSPITPTLADEIMFYDVSGTTTGKASLSAVQTLLGGGSGSSGTTPSYATTMTVSAPSSMTVGSASTVTVTGGSGGLDPAKTFTPSAPVAGTFSPTSRAGNGTTALTFSFTPSAAGSGTFSASASGVTATPSATVTISSAQSPATTYTISTASTGTVGTAQTVTVTATGTLSSAVVVTLSDGASGTFGSTVTLAAGTNSSGTTQYTPAGSAGTRTITGTNNGGLTNPAGTSVTVAAAAGGGGPSYPALVFAGGTPTFETASPLYGAASLKVAAASGTPTVPAAITATATVMLVDSGNGTASFSLGFPFKGTGSSNAPEGSAFITITDSAGRVAKIEFGGTSARVSSGGSSYFYDTVNIRDGSQHYIKFAAIGGYGNAYFALEVDAARPSGEHNNAPAFAPGAATVQIKLANAVVGDLIDSIDIENNVPEPNGTPTQPSGAATRGANTNVIWTFDTQDGKGS